MSYLRKKCGEVLNRAAQGETLTVTRYGVPVVRLEPIVKQGPTAARLIARRQHLPVVNSDKLRSDLETLVDASAY